MNNPNVSGDQANLLLQIAGKKLGQDPEALKQQLQENKLDGIMSKMPPQARQKMSQMLQDPQALEALLSDDKVKNMIAGFLGGKK